MNTVLLKLIVKVLVTMAIMVIVYMVLLVISEPDDYLNPVIEQKVTQPRGMLVVPVQAQELTLEDKIRSYDWNDDLMVAIAKYESSGDRCELNPSATNDQNKNGSQDSGLLQVNSIHGYSREYLLDVDNNIEVAYKIYNSQGITAWAAYNNGRYLRCL